MKWKLWRGSINYHYLLEYLISSGVDIASSPQPFADHSIPDSFSVGMSMRSKPSGAPSSLYIKVGGGGGIPGRPDISSADAESLDGASESGYRFRRPSIASPGISHDLDGIHVDYVMGHFDVFRTDTIWAGT